ncbi:hypothetical protein N7492_006244 [Penicillium capsulatum]|uniref:Uncharacterized protein n=1 Tax=Penicillium capsulatum TaxID=69766 RepID=A0A9W9I375_9EURO|nr:hypothetical protein N7492_006244 [Penicillium capsulatum]KAJ6108896.1 hypothetical protein N7512_008733 [Penicillium capsulatum]
MIQGQTAISFLGFSFSNLQYPLVTIILGAAIIAIFFYSLHLKVTELVLNNFQPTDPWIPEAELVLLTGGSSGIGKQLMSDLARQRIRIVMLDIQPPPFDLPDGVSFYKTDITSAEAIAAVATRIRDTHGDPTVLVSNAGVFHHGSILEKPEQEIRQTFDVNAIAPFLLLKEFLPALIRANRGHVITIASMASFVAVGEMVDYCCSKASMLAFYEGLRLELKYWYHALNVRTRLATVSFYIYMFPLEYIWLFLVDDSCSIVHPLWVETPMIKGFTDHRTIFGQSIMSPSTVSEAIIDHLVSRKSGPILLPRTLSLAGALRALPLWLQEYVRAYFSKVVRRVSDARAAGKVQERS